MTCMCLILSSSTGDKYNKLPELSHMSLFKPICVHCFSGQNSDVGGRLPDVSGASRTSRRHHGEETQEVPAANCRLEHDRRHLGGGVYHG